MKDNLCPIVGISCGDLNGIGVEIILKSLRDSRILEFFTPIIFANQELLLSQKKKFNIELSFTAVVGGWTRLVTFFAAGLALIGTILDFSLKLNTFQATSYLQLCKAY